MSDSQMPDVEGAPSADNEIVVTYLDRTLRFAPFGGRIEARLRSNTFYEGELLHYIESLRLHGTYLDIGGYVGTHALFFAQYCPSDKVHSFEPRAHCYKHLAHNVAANSMGERLIAHQLGLSDKDETVPLTLAKVTEQIECHPVDTLVDTPVCLMKLDVEGMEAKVLAGATRILRAYQPLVFVEAHTKEELDADLVALAPYGYRLTGRVFNASPTYELAVPGSPTAGDDRLPVKTSLLDAAWDVDDPAVAVSRTASGLRVTSTLTGDARAHATQKVVNAKRAPEVDLVEVSPFATVFVQAMGTASAGLDVSLTIGEYDDHGRLDTQRVYFHPRLFQRLALRPETRRLRVSIRVGGTGELSLDEIALHVLAPTSAATLEQVIAAHWLPGAEVHVVTTPEAKLPSTGAPLAIVVQDLPPARAGRAARGPVVFDAELAPRVVHILRCDDPFTILDRGLLAQAARGGWELASVHRTADKKLPLALAFAHQRSSTLAPEQVALRNERRFAELLRAEAPHAPPPSKTWRARFGRAIDQLRGED